MIGTRVVCINDSNMPQDFPKSLWVKKDQIYTIAKIDRMWQMGGILGVQLEELDTNDCFPYTHFNANRFAPLQDDGELSDQELEDLFEEIEQEDLVTH